MRQSNLFQITAPHFCAGGTYDEDKQVETWAPIIRYMDGWSEEEVKAYCRKKRWSYKLVDISK